jgi:hypothetical protein
MLVEYLKQKKDSSMVVLMVQKTVEMKVDLTVAMMVLNLAQTLVVHLVDY